MNGNLKFKSYNKIRTLLRRQESFIFRNYNKIRTLPRRQKSFHFQWERLFILFVSPPKNLVATALNYHINIVIKTQIIERFDGLADINASNKIYKQY